MPTPNRIVDHGPMGALVDIPHQRAFRLGTSIPACKENVNMVCLQYAETTESKNHSAHGKRQASDCTLAGLLCAFFIQRSNPFRPPPITPRHRTAVPSTHHT